MCDPKAIGFVQVSNVCHIDDLLLKESVPIRLIHVIRVPAFQ